MQRTVSARAGLLCPSLLTLLVACSPKSDTGTASGGTTATPWASAPAASAEGTPPATTPAATSSNDVDWDAYRRQTEAAPRDTLAPDAYRGWKQFELNCSRCHGEFGVGTSFGPSLVVSLKNGGTVPDYASFLSVVCGGRKEKGMPAWCELGLDQDKIQDIYSYLKLRADGKIGVGRPAQRG